jgi:peptide/nickel transport system permease protein
MKGDRRLLVWGAALLAVIALMAIAAEAIAPSDPAHQIDPIAGQELAPGSRGVEVRLADRRGSILVDEAEPTETGLRVTRGGESWTIPESELDAPGMAATRDRFFLLGTDQFGRDVWSRLLFGARVSLWIGGLAAAIALFIGVGIGGIAATAGGAVDSVLMRLTDALLAFPGLFLVIALAAVFDASAWLLILILGATGWMTTARLTHAEILTLRRRDFVFAAEAVGQSPGRIFLHHLLPNALTPIIAYTALRIGDIILLEAGMSFLGIGVEPSRPTWGKMIAEGSNSLHSAWWVATFPGIAIAVTVIALHMLGDGLRARLDPRSR